MQDFKPMAILALAALLGCGTSSDGGAASQPPPAGFDALGTSDAGPTAQPDAGSGDSASPTPTPDGGLGPDSAKPSPVCDDAALGTAEGFEHTLTELVTVNAGSARHRGQDVVVISGQPQRLVGKFAYGDVDKDLKDERVDIYVQRDGCVWELLGSEWTSEDGEYGTVDGVEDDGGRIFFTIPAALALAPGRYPIRMVVRGDMSSAFIRLVVVEPGVQVAVFDIDGTLTTNDLQVALELVTEILGGTYVPEMHEGAPKVAWAWADLGYLPVYVTGRPDILRDPSEQWLIDRGLPPGVLHTTDTLSQALPTETGVGAYKTDFLTRLKEQVPIAGAYGNAATDIAAYEAVGVPKDRTWIIGDNAGKQGTQALTSYVDHLPVAQGMPQAAVPAPAAQGW